MERMYQNTKDFQSNLSRHPNRRYAMALRQAFKENSPEKWPIHGFCHHAFSKVCGFTYVEKSIIRCICLCTCGDTLILIRFGGGTLNPFIRRRCRKAPIIPRGLRITSELVNTSRSYHLGHRIDHNSHYTMCSLYNGNEMT